MKEIKCAALKTTITDKRCFMTQKGEIAQFGDDAPKMNGGCPCKEGREMRMNSKEPYARFEPAKNITAFKIEKDVPIPSTRGRSLFPWKLMEVGDSFFFPTTQKHSAFLYMSAKKAGIKITVITEKQGDVTGKRIWRNA